MLICFSKQKFAIEKYNNFLLPQGNGLYLQRFYMNGALPLPAGRF